MTNNSLTLFHLSLIPGVSSAAVYVIYQHAENVWQSDLQEIYKLSVTQLQKIGLSEKVARAVHTGLRDITVLEREIGLLEKHDISIITIDDEIYPTLLSTIHVPPAVLYIKGVLPSQPYVAFVGSRQANTYGQRAIDQLVPDVIAAGITIISGGAQGIDTMVHQAALDHGGTTIAVVGTGLLTTYPTTNKRLFEKIVERGGAIISPFALDAGAEPWRFPVRNRIIAGMSQATVVVQAAQKSGALITAAYALQEGRVVGAVPGPIDDSISAGCHELLKQGASLIHSSADLLQECAIVGKSVDLQQELISNQNQQKTAQEDQDKGIPPIKVRIDRAAHGVATENSIEDENVDELELLSRKLLRYCKQPISTFDLSLQVGMSEVAVQAALFELQLDGKLIQDFAGLWRLA